MVHSGVGRGACDIGYVEACETTWFMILDIVIEFFGCGDGWSSILEEVWGSILEDREI